MVTRIAIGCAAFAAALASASPPGEVEALAGCYLRAQLCEQTRGFAAGLAEPGTPEAATVAAFANAWCDRQMARAREDLVRRLGDGARDALAAFVERHVEAAAKSDAAYRAKLAADLGLDPAPADYAALEAELVRRCAATEMKEASALLGELETWVALRRRDPSAPGLEAWLQRGGPAAPSAPPSVVAQLREQEPALPEPGAGGDGEGDSAMAAFAAERKARREKIFETAMASMSTVASARETAEKEAGARKLAAAQADAEAVKRQAAQLSAGEEEALAQRENLWSTRIRGVVGGTLNATVSTFTGEISTKAAEKAVESVFR